MHRRDFAELERRQEDERETSAPKQQTHSIQMPIAFIFLFSIYSIFDGCRDVPHSAPSFQYMSSFFIMNNNFPEMATNAQNSIAHSRMRRKKARTHNLYNLCNCKLCDGAQHKIRSYLFNGTQTHTRIPSFLSLLLVANIFATFTCFAYTFRL